MKEKGLGLLPLVFAFVAKRLNDFHQNLGSHWSQVPNKLVTFDIHIWTCSNANHLYVTMTSVSLIEIEVKQTHTL